jgi:hypothetical protein
MSVESMPTVTGSDPAPEWAQLMRELNAAGQKAIALLPKDATAEDRCDAYLSMLGCLMSAYLTLVRSDPDHPLFVHWVGFFENATQPNCDTRYLNTAIRGDGVYRLVGKLGNVPKTLLAVLPVSDFLMGTFTSPLDVIDLDTLSHDADGHFELTLSANRPVDCKGEWRRLDPNARQLMLRYDSDDWGKQREPIIAVDRIDVPSRATRRSAADILEKLSMIPPYAGHTPVRWVPHVRELPENTVQFTNYGASIGAVPLQAYYEGIFNFGEDEALLLETAMPKTCRYWSIELVDLLFSTLDWVNNQASLNRSQATLDKDGKLRVVIAHSDPGVPNWLDTIGRKRGVIGGRWYLASNHPLPTVRKVKLADVRKQLPAETPTVTPGQRNLILRERRDAAQFRGLW